MLLGGVSCCASTSHDKWQSHLTHSRRCAGEVFLPGLVLCQSPFTLLFHQRDGQRKAIIAHSNDGAIRVFFIDLNRQLLFCFRGKSLRILLVCDRIFRTNNVRATGPRIPWRLQDRSSPQLEPRHRPPAVACRTALSCFCRRAVPSDVVNERAYNKGKFRTHIVSFLSLLVSSSGHGAGGGGGGGAPPIGKPPPIGGPP